MQSGLLPSSQSARLAWSSASLTTSSCVCAEKRLKILVRRHLFGDVMRREISEGSSREKEAGGGKA